MPDAVDADSIAEAAASPASASVDGQSASAVSISEQIKAQQNKEVADALTGTNQNGGPVSGWSKMRMARARNCGGPQ
jgi:hypothetical protein